MKSNLSTNTAMLISPVREDVGTVEGDKHSDNNLHYGQDHFPLLEIFKDRHFSRIIINPVHAIAQVARSKKVLIQIWLVGDHCWRTARARARKSVRGPGGAISPPPPTPTPVTRLLATRHPTTVPIGGLWSDVRFCYLEIDF